MKKVLTLCALLFAVLTGFAQTEVDIFNVGPYNVEYYGQGDYRYRLKDNVNLYEFFELRKDTTVINVTPHKIAKNAFVLSGNVGANRFFSKEIGLEGVWKHNIKSDNLYFGVGLDVNFTLANDGDHSVKRNMFELGVPLQIELGRLDFKYSSLYGLFGIMPTFYSTMKAEGGPVPTKVVNDENVEIDVKKSGFLIAPMLEFGGNVPVGPVIMRIGVYAKYKINCTTSDYDVYGKGGAGRMFLGAKIGFAL